MDLQQLDWQTRKLLSMHGTPLPVADIDRLDSPFSEGGQGLQQIESMYQPCIVRLDCYLCNNSDPSCKWYRKYDSSMSSSSIQRIAYQFTAQLQGSLARDNKSQSLHGSETILCDGVFKLALQMDAKHFCICNSFLHVQSWGRKPRHGHYCRLTEKLPVDMKETYGWLKSWNLPTSTEGLVVAQD